MIFSHKCPKCGSTKIAGPHRVMGRDHVRIDLPGFSTATLETFTCADCGYTEFYSDRTGLENIRRSGRYVLNQQPNPATSPSTTRSNRCSLCGAVNPEGSTVCRECGSPL
ncbi:MAG: hypothetical protein DRO87_02930 [Candidatus Thorarchaeota archaeon]|nr:MAG: hypothetical protein DRP09_04805 [Candidatus Thorarchaeota archaeon]RLI59461.1 MAG: hypothetical protein DRO87_02930 [Candidatus Thorarchaeota archaeon]